MLESIVLFGHIGVALLIIILVLLQRGKGADAGSGFGAGASGTVFGARGSASFFSRATALLATVFFLTSLSLAYLATQASAPESLLDGLESSISESQSPAIVPSVSDDALPSLPEGIDLEPQAGEVSEEIVD